MLHQMLKDHRAELIERARIRVAARSAPKASAHELTHGVPLFLDQLEVALQAVGSSEPPTATAISDTAGAHGQDLLKIGFTVGQVVQDYGDVCQAVTELAMDRNLEISTAEFHMLNFCLDEAIAGAVSAWERQRELNISEEALERLGVVAHEQRNLLSTALLAFQLLRKGTVAIGGSTGSVLGRALEGLRNINSGSLAEVRLSAGLQKPVRIRLAEFIEEEEIAASLSANERGLQLTVERPDYALSVSADRMILGAALANLVHNAFKFTRAGGQVFLRVRSFGTRVLIQVEDECGGLPKGSALFSAFVPGTSDAAGLGLGLSISRRCVEANGGRLEVRDLPGRGCIFTIDLPALASTPGEPPKHLPHPA